MREGEPPVVLDTGTVVEPGGVYLTFHDDPDEPYMVAKVLRIGGGSSGYAQLRPDMTTVDSPTLWLKMYRVPLATRPRELPAAVLAGPTVVLAVTVAVFGAWGPPAFPACLGTEPVTAEELAAMAAVRHLYP
jgi:hypothetical protein